MATQWNRCYDLALIDFLKIKITDMVMDAHC